MVAGVQADITPQARYVVTVTYLECANGNMSRTEEWKNAQGKVVYSEVYGCDSITTYTGIKPKLWISGGLDALELADANRNMATTPINTALNSYLTYTSKDTIYDNGHGEITIDYTYDINYFDAIPADEIAQTTQYVSNNLLTITTDKSVKVRLVNLQTGQILTDPIEINSNYSFDISNYENGCKYAAVITQTIPNVVGDLIIKTNNFCK